MQKDGTWKTSENGPSPCNASGLSGGLVSIENRARWEPTASVHIDRDVTPDIFVGGKVKLIRVTQHLNKPLDAEREVRRVWFGKFQDAACYQLWAEYTRWNVKAVIEFEDGRSGSLMTDGNHVQLQDQNGKFWFIRLRPAV